MPNRLRTLGIGGKNLKTKKALGVNPADFTIAGIIGKFERQYKKAFLCRNIDEFREIFGDQTVPSWYGWDVVNGFFENVAGTSAKAYIVGHVGYDGSAYDGVMATKNFVDQDGTPEDVLQVDFAYETEECFGSAGNNIGITILNGFRFETASNGAGLATDTWVDVDSVSDIKVGDTIHIDSTTDLYRVVTGIDESARRVTFSTATGEIVPDASPVNVLGFQIKTYKKSVTGVIDEVDPELGKVWCTIGSAVPDYYVENVFSTSKHIKVSVLSTATVDVEKQFPADQSTVSYLESGSDGTGTTTASNIWDKDLEAFDDLPIRMFGNAECIAQTINEAGETYAKGRWDNPKWIYNIASDRTKSQLLVIGNNYQRSDDVLGIIPANWLEVEDPFSTSSLSPYREVPNIGHIMGIWCRSIVNNGVHFVPSLASNPIRGAQGIVGDTFLDDDDRTDLAEAGINVIQDISGSGIVLKNFFTPSTTLEFMFGNGILMRSYFMVSVRDSVLTTENEPNSFARIKASKMAILKFYYSNWEKGSTGDVPEGETFGQSFNENGEGTDAEEHFEVQADIVNNPQSAINAGERNLDSWFTYPSPAGSIRIGIGFIVR